jgi:hypothetical protein
VRLPGKVEARLKFTKYILEGECLYLQCVIFSPRELEMLLDGDTQARL